MTEFIWFFGASGAGKATLIAKIADGLFRLDDITKPVVCRESLAFERDQRVESLERVLDTYAARHGSILIKGQSIDLSRLHISAHLQEKYPKIRQRVVFVYVRPELLPQRTAYRNDSYWPNPKHDFASETAFQIDEVAKLCALLKIQPIIVDNAASKPHVASRTKLADLEKLKLSSY